MNPLYVVVCTLYAGLVVRFLVAEFIGEVAIHAVFFVTFDAPANYHEETGPRGLVKMLIRTKITNQ